MVKSLTRLRPELPSLDEFVRAQNVAGVSTHKAVKQHTEHKRAEVWVSETYIVTLFRNYTGEMNAVGPARTMMSVRRADGETFGNWNDIQEMKNQLLGSEAELVQLFPAESRKVDMVNQYWFYDNTGLPFNFGAKRREVNNR